MPNRDSDPRYNNANDETEIFPSSYSDCYSGSESQYSGGNSDYCDDGYSTGGYNREYNSGGYSAPSNRGYNDSNCGYNDAGYYSDQQYQSYQQAPAQSPAPQQSRPQSRPQKSGPSISDQFDIPKFIGSVVAVAIVASITAYVVAWILELVMERIATYVNWTYPPIDRTYYAIFAALVAIFAALLWWVLNIGTTLPSLFYSWIVGVVLVAAVVLPLLLTTPFYNGIIESVMNLVVGLPVVYLIAPIGNSARKN
ncbi:hypothetical protein [Corynebacterium kroppenstedtii]|uniref:hypothetical protein n=1 Tax=Corynebacterium kroppenstedtii TaxID=161879 RepID=UPI003873C0BD